VSTADILARWHGFLAKAHARVHEILAEATTGCAQLFEADDHDPRAMSTAWSAMQRRAEQLVSKIDETWNVSVDDELGDDQALRTAERERGDALTEQLGHAIEGTRRRIFAEAARALWQRALTEVPTTLRCTQCAAPQAVPSVWQAVNVACPHCAAVITYEPGTRARMVEHFAVPALCEEGTWSQWLALRSAERGRRGHTGDLLPALQAHEQAQLDYERCWLELRARMLPAHAAALEIDLRGRMAAFYQSLDSERAWIEAGRPRALR
jgi:ribosomal protein S27E